MENQEVIEQAAEIQDEGQSTAVPNVNAMLAQKTDDALRLFASDFLKNPESGNDELIARWLYGAVAPRCPQCKLVFAASLWASFYALKRVKCKSCGKWFTALTGTMLHGAHNPRAIFLIAVFWGLLTRLEEQDIDFNSSTPTLIKTIAGLTGLSPDTVRLWVKKLAI